MQSVAYQMSCDATEIFQFLKERGLEKTLATLRQELANSAVGSTHETPAAILGVCESEGDLAELIASMKPQAKLTMGERGDNDEATNPSAVHHMQRALYLRSPATDVFPFQSSPVPSLPMPASSTDGGAATEAMSLKIVYQPNHSGFEKQAEFPIVVRRRSPAWFRQVFDARPYTGLTAADGHGRRG